MDNLKKKILICIHNPFALVNLQPIIEEIKSDYEITIFTSNYFLNNQSIHKKVLEIKKNSQIKNFFIIPSYKSNSEKRSFFSIIKSHYFLYKFKSFFKKKKFNLCISDGSFFIWQKIILTNFLEKNCIRIGLTHDSLNLHLDEFQKFLNGKKIDDILRDVHKLRQIKKNNNKFRKKKFFLRIVNTIKRIEDLYIDRQIIPLILYGKKFIYMKNDLKTAFDTNSFKYIINFFYSSFRFWGKYYGEENTFLVKPKNNCGCNIKKKKNKILFISSFLWNEESNSLDFEIDHFFKFIEKTISEHKEILEIDFRHHPMQSDKDIKFFNEYLIKKNKKEYNINFEHKYDPISKITCEYKLIFGCSSSALYFAKHGCYNAEIVCLKSLSVNELGEKYYYKLWNEGIIMYDDINNSFDNLDNLPSKEYLTFKQSIEKIEKIDKHKNLIYKKI